MESWPLNQDTAKTQNIVPTIEDVRSQRFEQSQAFAGVLPTQTVQNDVYSLWRNPEP